MEGTPTIKSQRKLLQIIDTTLLQCYLHVRTSPSSFTEDTGFIFMPAYVSVYAHEST